MARARGEAARAALLAAANRPAWNIRGDALGVVAGHLAAGNGSDAALAFWWMDDSDCEDEPDYEVTEDGVAIIPVHGVLLDAEPDWWMRYIGYASTPQIARAVTAAYEDANVTALLLDIDSPGGQVSGLLSPCNALWEARQAGGKKIWAACSEACSAAMEIASQCERVYLSPDGMGVCLGTIITPADWSGYYTQMGVTVHRITSDGAETYKGAGTRGTELTPEQQADWKRVCNEYRDLFNPIVARGRGMTEARIAELADGRAFVGANAVALGLFDAVATPEEVLAALGSGGEIEGAEAVPPPEATPPDDDDDPDDSRSRNTVVTAVTARRDIDRPTGQTATKGNPKMRIFGNRSTAAPTAAADTTAPDGAANADNAAAPADAAAALTSAEREELTSLREFHARMLGHARTEAKAAAVTAFAQGTPELQRAQAMIDRMVDPEAIADLIPGYEAMTPAPFRGQNNGAGNGRQTESTIVQGTEEADDATFFAGIRAQGASANGTAPKGA